MVGPVVIERTNLLSPRLYGLASVLVPGGLGAWLLAPPSGFAAKLAGALLLLFALFMLRTTLRFAKTVSLVGDRARVRSLWTRSEREIDLHGLADVAIRLAPQPNEVAVAPASINLSFADGERLFLGPDFAGAAQVAESAIQTAGGIRFPVHLASGCLCAWLRFLQDPRLGVSAGYVLPAGQLTLYFYRGDAATVPPGPGSDLVAAELAKACADMDKRFAAEGARAPELLERGVLGEGTALPMLKATFAVQEIRGPATSCVFLTGHAGHFLKGRFTGADPHGADAALAALGEQLAAIGAPILES